MNMEQLRHMALIDYHLFKCLDTRRRIQFILAHIVTLFALGVFFYLIMYSYLTPYGRTRILLGLGGLAGALFLLTALAFTVLDWIEKNPILSNLLFFGMLATFTAGVAVFGDVHQWMIPGKEAPNFLGLVFTLATVAFYAANYFLMAVLYKAVTDKAEVDTEIALARNIQIQLLPAIQTDQDRYSIYGFNRPAREVGGDYFDTILLPDGRLVLVIGDVSGHNLAAGLLMAVTKAAFRTELNYLTQPLDLLNSLNRTILENSDKRMFVSLMFAVVDFNKGTMTLANAGHNPMLFYRLGGEVKRMGPKGMALGISPRAFFGVEVHAIQPGDLFLLYTDGLQEAQNGSGEEFGLTRMEAVLKKAHSSPTALCSYLIDAAEQFAGSRLSEDDVTLLALQVGKGSVRVETPNP